MSDLSIRGMDLSAVRYTNTSTPENAAGTAKAGETSAASEVSPVSKELQSLVDRLGSMAGGLTGAERRLLQSGEGTLDEVRSALGRMAQLLSGGGADSVTLQNALQDLSREVDRMLAGASFNGVSLFGSEGEDAYAELAKDLASVLHRLVENASTGQMPENGDMATLMDAIRQLMDKMAGGTAPDQALFELTNSSVDSFLELAGQLTGEDDMAALLDALFAKGTIPGLTPGDGAALASFDGLEGYDLDLLLGMTSALQESSAAARQEAPPESMETKQFGGFEVSGRDLSGVSCDPKTGLLTLSGDSEVTVSGEGKDILLTGSGALTLKDLKGGQVTVDGGQATILSAGESELKSVQLRPGASVVLDGEGSLGLKQLTGGKTNALSVTGGAVTVDNGRGDLSALGRVTVVGGASLAAHAANVQGENGQIKSPMDLLLDRLLPGWTRVTSVEVDGSETKMSLPAQGDPARLWLERGFNTGHGNPIHSVTITGRDENEIIRTRFAYVQWDERQGRFVEVVKYPNPFTVTGGVEGEDWTYDQYTQTLRLLTGEVTAVSGGPGIDAEEAPFSGKLSVAGNVGELSLTLDGVSCKTFTGSAFELGRENEITLWLPDGTENRFESGSGFAGVSVGDGTRLIIDVPPPPECDEEGEAPVEPSEEEPLPPGTLTAVGGDGGAGIGRDNGGSWDRISSITIRGGVVTAVGGGGGAGIGAGKHGFMGDIEISGGRIKATGGKLGGAGIGGALGAPVGDIRITGGEIEASASYHAAAIGAGVEGECGAVYIGPKVKLKAKGGDPGTDIGACIFGKSGEVTVENGADTGLALSRPDAGESLSVKLGEELTLARMQLTSRTLLLNHLNVADWDSAWAAKGVVNAALRRAERLRAVCGAMNSDGDGETARDAASAAGLLDAVLEEPSGAANAMGRPESEQVSRLLR